MILHTIGLTNLSDEQVRLYCRQKQRAVTVADNSKWRMGRLIFAMSIIMAISIGSFVIYKDIKSKESKDFYIKEEIEPHPMAAAAKVKNMGKEIWLGSNKMAVISEDSHFIFDLNKNKLYIVNHKNKTYVVATLPLDMKKLMPMDYDSAMLKMDRDSMTFTIKPNGRNKKILNWNTKGFDMNIKMNGIDIKITFWASEDVPFDWKKYLYLYAELYKLQFRMGQKFIEEFKKIKGYPLATEINFMGVEIKSTPSDILYKSAGAGVYSVPPDYTKKDNIQDL